MKKNLITWNNIKHFLEAYSRKYYDMLVGLPDHQKEQIEYRYNLCKSTCGVKRECVVCKCNFPDKLFQINTCNKDRFPDIMSRVEWENFKLNNNINEGEY